MDLTIKDAARLLHASEATIYRWIRDGSLPSHRIGDHYRLNRVEVLEWATAKNIKVSPEIFREEQSPQPTALLTEAFRLGGVLRDVAGNDKVSVLKAVCEQLPLPAEVNRQELLGVLLAREALGSTAIGKGIAIPHPRSPLIVGVQRPYVTLAFLAQPIPFGAMDGIPVSVLFLILSTTIRGHLQLLSRLMFTLQDEAFSALLGSKATAERIIECAAQIELRGAKS